MNPALEVAIVTAFLSVLGAALTFYLTKRAERRDKLQQRKLEHYAQLMNAISDLASDGVDQSEANERFNRSVNTIVLVVPHRRARQYSTASRRP
ncbi:MAG: hypothetical protein U0Q16_38505 [Bryobacteraceae bacterium]